MLTCNEFNNTRESRNLPHDSQHLIAISVKPDFCDRLRYFLHLLVIEPNNVIVHPFLKHWYHCKSQLALHHCHNSASFHCPMWSCMDILFMFFSTKQCLHIHWYIPLASHMPELPLLGVGKLIFRFPDSIILSLLLCYIASFCHDICIINNMFLFWVHILCLPLSR